MIRIGVRHVQVMFLFSNSALIYLTRLYIAVTILAMTNETENNSKFPIFGWNEKQKSLIMASFYWGYIAAIIPAAYVVRRYDAKVTLFISTLGTGLFALLVPFCVPWGGWKIFCFLRALQGLLQGFQYPAFSQHLAKWSPLSERSLLGGLSLSGYNCGEVLAMLLGGMIPLSPLGWPGTFYISATLCFVWCVLWCLYGADDFTTSKFITLAERQMIESSLRNSVDFGVKKTLPIPWRQILRSMPFWALLIVRSTNAFSSYTLTYYLPTYMKNIFNLTMADNALYSSLPYMSSWLAAYIFTFLGGWLQQRNFLPLSKLRKLFNSIGCWLPAAFILWMAFIDEKQSAPLVALFVLLRFSVTAVTIGCDMNAIDIAPNYVAILTTLMSFGVNSTSMLGPLFFGLTVNDEHDRFSWQIVFSVVAVVYCMGDVVFFIWGSGNEESWNVVYLSKENAVNSIETIRNDVNSDRHKGETNLAFTKDIVIERNVS